MAITVFIRTRSIVQGAQFEAYSKRGSPSSKCGGDLVGYFMPHEGTNHIAFALISFEAWRLRGLPGAPSRDAEGMANFNFAEEQNSSLPRATFLARWWPASGAGGRFPLSARQQEKNMLVTTAISAPIFRKLHQVRLLRAANRSTWHRQGAAADGLQGARVDQRGLSWTIGKADTRVTVDEVCAHLTTSARRRRARQRRLRGRFADGRTASWPTSRRREDRHRGLSLEDSRAMRPSAIRSQPCDRTVIKAARRAIDADNAACC